MQMYKDIIEEVERVQRERLFDITVSTDQRTKLARSSPPRGASGLYFFYTTYSLDDLIASGDAPTTSAVPIATLARNFGRLRNVRKIEDDGYWLVYNGIGGGKTQAYDLRSRILQQIKSSDDRTGSLCLRQTNLNDMAKWKYSYVSLASTGSKVSPDIDDAWTYEKHGRDIETWWRIHYGWPILNRR